MSRLENAGLLERQRDPADWRGVRLRLTPAGRDLAARVGPEVRRLHQSLRAVLLRYMAPEAVAALE